MTATHRLATLCFTLLLGSIGSAQQAPANKVTPGEFTIEPPTLINLGFEWRIDGDANRSAKVDVSYRKVGDAAWKTGLPLLRLQGEKVTQPNVFGWSRRTCSLAASSTSIPTPPTRRDSC